MLPELKSLENLILPNLVWSWPKEELEAIAALRQHPALRQIQFGIAMNGLPDSSTKLAAEFWQEWDRETQPVLALHRSRVRFSSYWRDDGFLAVTIDDPAFTDLSVFRGVRLGLLTLEGTEVRDLTPLAGLPLKSVTLKKVPITDLSILATFPLENLTVQEMDVTDLTFLHRAPLCDSLEALRLEKLKIADFSPVAACRKLRLISMWESPLADLAHLRELKLQELYLQGSQVRDLSPLAGMPLERLFIDRTPATDLTPLLGLVTLRDVMIPEKAENIESLRKLPALQRISFSYDSKIGGPSMTAAEFWAGFPPKKP